MQLIYRGQVTEYVPPQVAPYRKPSALNWRYHAPGETYDEASLPRHATRTPQAINWRWQVQ